MKRLALTTALFAASAPASAGRTIFKGRGYGTYYYDIKQVKACGTDFSNQNKGNVMCSFTQALPLNQINSNYIVAMNDSQLRGNLDKYCGKRVVVTVNGKTSDLPLFIGDGCERCGIGAPDGGWHWQGAPGLDFSYSVLQMLTPKACSAGHEDISWEIVDENLHHFSTRRAGR